MLSRFFFVGMIVLVMLFVSVPVFACSDCDVGISNMPSVTDTGAQSVGDINVDFIAGFDTGDLVMCSQAKELDKGASVDADFDIIDGSTNFATLLIRPYINRNQEIRAVPEIV